MIDFPKVFWKSQKWTKINVHFSKSHCTFEAKKRKFTRWELFRCGTCGTCGTCRTCGTLHYTFQYSILLNGLMHLITPALVQINVEILDFHQILFENNDYILYTLEQARHL